MSAQKHHRPIDENASHASANTGLALELPQAVVEVIAARAAELLAARLPASEDRWMNVEEAAVYLACGPRRIYDLHSQRRLRSHRDGSRLSSAAQTSTPTSRRNHDPAAADTMLAPVADRP
jgi:excisionase family DNA binding protein